MDRSRIVRILIATLICGAASSHSRASPRAQDLGTWLWEVATEDGDALVEPGESAKVSLSMDLSPDVGDFIDRETFVLGFDTAIIDVIGEENAELGHIVDWELNPALFNGPFGDTDGASILGIWAVQLPQQPDFDTSDPISVLTFEWTPDALSRGPYQVEYSTATAGGFPGEFLVWANSDGDIVTLSWPVSEAAITIDVIPAPAPAALLAMPTLTLSLHRRRGSLMNGRQTRRTRHGRYLFGRVCANRCR